MPNITNAEAVKFCNEKARRLADLMESARRTAEQFAIDITTEFESHVGGNAGSDVIVDGSATDGRSTLTKDSIGGLKYVAEQLVACLNQDDREALVAAVSVNGSPLF